MKKLILWLSLICLTAPSSLFAAPKVKDKKDGIYYQEVWGGWYQADSIAHICLYGQKDYSSVTEVDCLKLANRPEWQTVISWKEAPAAPVATMTPSPETTPESEDAKADVPDPQELKKKKK